MSTDFSIKPVGAPVAAPIAPVVSDAGQNAIATQLPPSQSVGAADASVRISIDTGSAGVSSASAPYISSQAFLDRDAGSVVFQVIDNRTSEVVRQYPDEAVLRRRAYFRTLDLTKEAPTRLRATDRSA